MDNYSVGQNLTVRILEIRGNNFVVDLDGSGIGNGLVKYGAKKTSAKEGDYIDVVVKEVNDNVVFLELPEILDHASQSNLAQFEEQPWNGWEKIPTGHDQAISALVALRNHTDAFRNELILARKEWETAKERNQRSFDNTSNVLMQSFENSSAAARAKRDEAIAVAQAALDKSIESIASYRSNATAIDRECNSFMSTLRGCGIDSAVSAASRNLSGVTNKRNELIAVVERSAKAYRALFTAKVELAEKTYNEAIAAAERERNEKLDRARTEKIEADKSADQRFRAKYNETCNSHKKDIEEGFSESAIIAYQQKIRSSMFNPVNYECVSEVPEYVALGETTLVIPNESQDDVPVIHAVDMQTKKIGTRDEDKKEYLVKIPYTQRLSDGISLLIRYRPENRNYAQRMMQPLLLKLFMSFPAGKLEATMIDPLELGATFPDIPKLASGPNSARIIDTKIWSKEKDIEMAIATLRQNLENMTQAYGGDQTSRLKKEAVRALVITDFPVGFSEPALKDLHAIVRNSASLGVCVLICANDEELKNLKSRNGNLVNEITQGVVETTVSNNKLVFVGNDKKRIFLELDDMKEALERKDKIIPMIASSIEHMTRLIEHFDTMFKSDIHDSNNWFTGNHDEVSIPIGIKGADTIVNMVLGRGGGSTEHHALVTGQTGAGKSTFLHTLIMSTMVTYSPDEVQMYLLDFKEGVEFNAYARYRLPSLRVVAINSEREFGLEVLRELSKELESRTALFQREVGTAEINDYLKKPNATKIPKLLLIFDEVQELFRSEGESDSISAECISLIQRLVTQGRAIGIHVILACQDFNNCSGLESCFSQMAIRIAIQGSVDGAASILKSDNEGIRSLQNRPAGAAIYNGKNGEESANNFFQISYLKEDEREELLQLMNAYYSDPAVAALYQDKRTRVLLSNAENDVHNCFNQLINEGPESIHPLGSTKDGYGLLLGQGFGRKSIFMPDMRRKDGDNLLVVTRDEKMALSLFEFAIMSVLYEELHTKADKANALVYVIDQFDEELPDEACDFDYFESAFPQQVKVGKKGDAEDIISSLYDIMMSRSDGTQPSDERIFFMFFGVNRAKTLSEGGMYSEEQEGEISPIEKLRKIITNGPAFGINSIMWGESRTSILRIIGDRYEKAFNKRIAYGLDEESMEMLVDETASKAFQGKTAVYYDYRNDNKNTHFRPYDVPAREWIEKYSAAYDYAINEGGV